MQKFEKILKYVCFVRPFRINRLSVRFFADEENNSGGRDKKTEFDSSIQNDVKLDKQNEDKVLKASILVQCDTKKDISDANIEQIDNKSTTSKLSGFAASFKKFSELDAKKYELTETSYTFTTLLRNSKFIDLGNPVNKIVVGTIIRIVGNDLYIDFGWKFHCVCQKPVKKAELYVRGTKVAVRVKDLELSTRFLGATTDITLLEADCALMGLLTSSLKKSNLQK